MKPATLNTFDTELELKNLAKRFTSRSYKPQDFAQIEMRYHTLDQIGTISLLAQLFLEDRGPIPGLQQFIDLSLQPTGPLRRQIDHNYVVEVQGQLEKIALHLY